MELWDVYDIDRNLTGRTMVRGAAFGPGDYHLVVHICVFNSRGQMLIQQRQPFKEDWSNLWDITVGGSSVAGEDSRMAAQRELFEEVGIGHDFTGILPALSVNLPHIFDDVYLIEKDVDETKLRLQYEEVKAVRWADKDQIKAMIDQGIFIPYRAALIDLLFDMRKKHGMHRI